MPLSMAKGKKKKACRSSSINCVFVSFVLLDSRANGRPLASIVVMTADVDALYSLEPEKEETGKGRRHRQSE